MPRRLSTYRAEQSTRAEIAAKKADIPGFLQSFCPGPIEVEVEVTLRLIVYS